MKEDRKMAQISLRVDDDIQQSPTSLSRAAISVYLPLTGWRGFAI